MAFQSKFFDAWATDLNARITKDMAKVDGAEDKYFIKASNATKVGPLNNDEIKDGKITGEWLYNATLNDPKWPQEVVAEIKTGVENKNWRVPIGGHLASMFLWEKYYKESAKIEFFDDPYFVKFLNLTYGMAKIRDGSKFEMNDKKGSETDSNGNVWTWDGGYFNFFGHKTSGNQVLSANVELRNMWRDKTSAYLYKNDLYSAHNAFIWPILAGGAGKGYNLQTELMEYLGGDNTTVASWEPEYKTLFLLMDGRKYSGLTAIQMEIGPNWIAPNNGQTPEQFEKYFEQSVHDFWKKNYPLAVELTALGGGIASAIAGFIKEPMTLAAFSRHVTHGVHNIDDGKYVGFWNQSNKMRGYADVTGSDGKHSSSYFNFPKMGKSSMSPAVARRDSKNVKLHLCYRNYDFGGGVNKNRSVVPNPIIEAGDRFESGMLQGTHRVPGQERDSKREPQDKKIDGKWVTVPPENPYRMFTVNPMSDNWPRIQDKGGSRSFNRALAGDYYVPLADWDDTAGIPSLWDTQSHYLLLKDETETLAEIAGSSKPQLIAQAKSERQKYSYYKVETNEVMTIKPPGTLLVFKNIENFKDKLRDSMETAVGNIIAGEYQTGTRRTGKPDHYYVPWVPMAYKPLVHISNLITNEFIRLEQRIQLFEELLSAKAINTHPDRRQHWLLNPGIYKDTNQESFFFQLYCDAVNACACKIAAWMYVLQVNLEVTIKFLAIQNLSESGVSADKIDEIMNNKASGPMDLSGIFDFDIAAPLTDDTKDADEIKKLMEERQEYFDQCLMLMNMDRHQKTVQTDILGFLAIPEKSYQSTDTSKRWYNVHRKWDFDMEPQPCPWGDRFHMLAHSEGQHSTITNFLTAPLKEKIRPFMELTPDVMSALTPKIRLHRIHTADGREVETEFVFRNYVPGKESKGLRDNPSKIQKGEAGGIKEFSFSYEGTTPATAKKDINAELTLYFQSFAELTKVRGVRGKEYRYIDLLLYPHNESRTKEGDDPNVQAHPDQYNPINFRIRADIGWNERTDDSFKEILKHHYREKIQNLISASDLTKDSAEEKILNRFNEAIRAGNRTFLLNMVDHNIDFRNDGSVEIKISYAAYVESQAKSSAINALSTPMIEAWKKYSRKKLYELLTEKACTQGQLRALKNKLAEGQKALISASQGSIARRLLVRGLDWSYYFSKKESKDYFENYNGLVPKPKVYSDTTDDDRHHIKVFSLGDIIYTAMDCLYDPLAEFNDDTVFDPVSEDALQYYHRRPEMENFGILLSSFAYSDYTKQTKDNSGVFSINPAEIPISLSYFNKFMEENVIRPERTVYPLMEFIQDLLSGVVDLMLEVCINKQIDTSLMFQTSQYSVQGYVRSSNANGYSIMPPLATETLIAKKYPGNTKKKVSIYPNQKSPYIFADKEYARKANEFGQSPVAVLPFATGEMQGIHRLPISAYYNYTHIYAVSPILSSGHRGTGIRSRDESKGIYHFNIGATEGILKNVKFTKTDMAFLREARYFNQGNYGLLQLGAVYNIELELFGNTLFYPGMEIFLDPRGFGGSDWDPTKVNSTANALGIGGYHVITKVQNNIGSSGFTTTVTAVFQYSGDVISRNQAVDGKAPNEKVKSLKVVHGKNIKKCREVLDKSIISTIPILPTKQKH